MDFVKETVGAAFVGCLLTAVFVLIPLVFIDDEQLFEQILWGNVLAGSPLLSTLSVGREIFEGFREFSHAHMHLQTYHVGPSCIGTLVLGTHDNVNRCQDIQPSSTDLIHLFLMRRVLDTMHMALVSHFFYR